MPTVGERTLQASFVVYGSVATAPEFGRNGFYSVTIGISETIKGKLPTTTFVLSPFADPATCANNPFTNTVGIFFFKATNTGAFTPNYLGPHSAIADATQTNLDAARQHRWITTRYFMPQILRKQTL